MAAIVGVILTACGASSAAARGPSKDRPAWIELRVNGVATRRQADPTAKPVEIPFQGSLRCEPDRGTGTGIYATGAAKTCRRMREEAEWLERIAQKPERPCTMIYGGPQRARIVGTIDRRAVDVTVTRADGCGIDDWRRLEWLLGAPER